MWNNFIQKIEKQEFFKNSLKNSCFCYFIIEVLLKVEGK